MAKVDYACLCHGFSVDRRSNRASIFDIVENLTIPMSSLSLQSSGENQIPGLGEWITIQFQIKVVAHFSRSNISEPEKIKTRIKYLTEHGQDVAVSNEVEIDLSNTFFNRWVSELDGITLCYSTEPHYQYVVVEIEDDGKWFESYRTPIAVTFIENDPS